MTKQPEALRIADLLERDPSEWGGLGLGWVAASELRRLHESDEEGWGYVKELEKERTKLIEGNIKILSALIACNEFSKNHGIE